MKELEFKLDNPTKEDISTIINLIESDTALQTAFANYDTDTLLDQLIMLGFSPHITSSIIYFLYISGYNLVKIFAHKTGELYIDNNSFRRDRCIKSIIVPEGITRIGSYAFYNSNLEHIYLPSSIESIGTAAFKHSLVLNIDINLTKEQFKKQVYLEKDWLSFISNKIQIAFTNNIMSRDELEEYLES